jgi:hypothetical protein
MPARGPEGKSDLLIRRNPEIAARGARGSCLYRRQKNPSRLSFRGAAGDKESRIALKMLRARLLSRKAGSE